MTSTILHLLLTPSDLIILGILLANLFFGFRRGFIRTVFGLIGKIGAFIGALVLAKWSAPYVAQYLVTPIIGSVFETKATRAIESAAGGAVSGDSEPLIQIIGEWFSGLLDPEALHGVAFPFQKAVQLMVESMAESVAYAITFFILIIMLTLLVKLMGGLLGFLTRVKPIGFLNTLAGGITGLFSGVLLCFLIALALIWFAPALFSPLGALSADNLDNTLLTRYLLLCIPSGLSTGL